MRKALYIMGILDDEDVQWISSNGRRLEVQKNEILVREGEPVDALFILLDGSLHVSTGGSPVATLFSGEMVGEISFIDSHPPSATVTAAQNSHVLAISKGMLQAKIKTDVWFASRFFHAVATFLADRLRATTAQLTLGNTGKNTQTDRDEIDLATMDSISLAAARFDKLLKRPHGVKSASMGDRL